MRAQQISLLLVLELVLVLELLCSATLAAH
jgi:hypothetical protein